MLKINSPVFTLQLEENLSLKMKIEKLEFENSFLRDINKKVMDQNETLSTENKKIKIENNKLKKKAILDLVEKDIVIQEAKALYQSENEKNKIQLKEVLHNIDIVKKKLELEYKIIESKYTRKLAHLDSIIDTEINFRSFMRQNIEYIYGKLNEGILDSITKSQVICCNCAAKLKEDVEKTCGDIGGNFVQENLKKICAVLSKIEKEKIIKYFEPEDEEEFSDVFKKKNIKYKMNQKSMNELRGLKEYIITKGKKMADSKYIDKVIKYYDNATKINFEDYKWIIDYRKGCLQNLKRWDQIDIEKEFDKKKKQQEEEEIALWDTSSDDYTSEEEDENEKFWREAIGLSREEFEIQNNTRYYL
jgi:hypothetical protein